jgi:histidinol-phosphate aminotransferase
MSGYVSGEQPSDADTIKLNTNENPYPPAPAITDALRQMNAADLRRYPPPMADGFRQIAADLHGLEIDNIIATRGGDELLRLVITTFVEPGQTIGVTSPTYSLYETLAEIQDCPVTSVPLDQDWQLPETFGDSMNKANAKLTLVVNPQAPTGQLTGLDRLRDLAEELNGILLDDEAYVDYMDPDIEYDSTQLIREFSNVIILRTLSKGYSLAGLRFGYGMADQELITPMLTKTRDSYNLDLFSQQIASLALEHQDHARQSWNKVIRERTRLGQSLLQLGFNVYPSQANFLMLQVPAPLDAAAIYQQLKQMGIYIRFFDTELMRDKLRITVGTEKENQRLTEALTSIKTSSRT